MTSEASPKIPAFLVGAEAHLTRRLALELRCGCPIVVLDGPRRTFVASLDAAPPTTVAWILAQAGEDAKLVVGAGRASSSIPSAAAFPPDHALALCMPARAFDHQRVLDASRPLVARADANFVDLAHLPPWAATLLRAAKGEGLLPALAYAECDGPDADVFRGGEHGLMAVPVALLQTDEAFPRPTRLSYCGSASMPLRGCESARILSFRSADRGTEHLAVEIGRPAQADAPLVRIHSSCLTGDLLGSLRCDCGDQLAGAVSRMAAEECGLVLYLPQEGRGIGLANKLRAYQLQDDGLDTIDANHALGWEDDARSWDAAVAMLEHCKIYRLRLLSNNRNKAAALRARGIEVVERLQHQIPPNTFNARYLRTKMARCGHTPDLEET